MAQYKRIFIIANLIGLFLLAGLFATRASAQQGGQTIQIAYLPLVVKPAPAAQPSQIIYSDPVTYLVDKYVTISNANFDLSLLKIYQPLATSWENQVVVTNGFYTNPTNQGYDPLHGNGVLYWKSTDTPQPGHSQNFGQQFTATVYAITAQVNPADVLPYDTGSELYQLYTRSEDHLEADDPLVVQAAQHAVGSETNPYLQAKLIYEWIAPHLTYINNQHLQGAVLTLQLGGGECGDYSSVFVAMARALGIPARPVVGYHAASGYTHHVWAEFYLQDLGWVPLDAQSGDMGDSANDWQFGNLDNGRIILSKNYNITLVPSSEKAELLQAYYWWYWGSGNGISADETWTVVGQ